MNINDKTNIDVTPLLSNDVLAEVDTETKVENEEKIWSVGDTWHHDLHSSEVSEAMKEYLDDLNKEADHHHDHHSVYVPLYIKPKPRQLFLPEKLGGGNSLAKTNEHRTATTNDLVLDLCFVYMLNTLVHVNLKNLMSLTEGTHSSGSSSSSNGGGHHLLSTSSSASSHNNSSFIPSTTDINSELSAQIFYGMRDCIALFVPIYMVWTDIVTLLNRFEQKDAIHLFFFAVNVFTFVFLGRTIGKCAGSDHTLDEDRADSCDYYIFTLMVCLFNIFLYHQYILWAGDARIFGRYAKEMSAWKMLQSIIWGFTALVGIPIWKNSGDPTIFLIGWWLALFVQMGWLLGMANGSSRKWINKKGMRSIFCSCCRHGCVGKQLADTDGTEYMPLNAHVQVERFDLFVVLSLGECIAGADVKGTSTLKNDPYIITKIIIAVITTLGIKFLAFDYAEHPTVSASRKVNKRKHIQHALTVSALRGIVFQLSYIPIILGVLFVSSILEDHIHQDGLTDELKRCIYGIGCFLIVFFTTVIQMVHQGKAGGEHRIPKRVRIGVRFLISFIMLMLPFLGWCNEVEDERDAACKNQAITFESLEAFFFIFTLMIDGWMRHPKKYNSDYVIYNAINECFRFRTGSLSIEKNEVHKSSLS